MSAVAITQAGIGHNSGALSLEDELADETIGLRARTDELIGSAGRASADDDDTADRAVTLAAMMGEQVKKIEAARVARKQPYIEAGRTVDRYFGSVATPLATARASVVTMIDAYRQEQERRRAAERRKLEEEARRLREENERAEAARAQAEAKARRAEEAQRRAEAEAERQAGEAERSRILAERAMREQEERRRYLEAEIEARRRQDEAAELERRAAATVATPIRSASGSVASARTTYTVDTISDLTAAIKHCRKVDEPSIRDAVLKIYQKQARAIGRAGKDILPGAEVVAVNSTTIRR